jgi:hypothetical protein
MVNLVQLINDSKYFAELALGVFPQKFASTMPRESLYHEVQSTY